jgi:predicted transcriptional regulator
MEVKQQMLKAIEELPDDAGIEEALDRLYLLYKVERGLRQADRGELLSQEEVRERMAKWLDKIPPIF